MTDKYGVKNISNIYLIVDSRERAVIPFIETELQNYAYIQKQINTGDYLICDGCNHEPKILACIERKTHEDFAASFKDGRYENIKKMLALRELTGCQLYFFVEGSAFPNLNRKYSRIPFSNILAAITKLMVCNGIFIVQTENEKHSAKRLADFLKTFDKHYVDEPVKDDPVKDDPVKDDPVKDKPYVDEPVEYKPVVLQVHHDELVIPDILLAKIEQTDSDAAVMMWSRLRGISIVLGKIITLNFSISDLVLGKISIDQIKLLKTATGRPINKDAITSLIAVKSGSVDHSIKIISGMRNITPLIAKQILLSVNGLSNLCNQTVDEIAIIKLQQKTRIIHLGKIRAQRIKNIINYKECDGIDADSIVDAADASILSQIVLSDADIDAFFEDN